MDELRGVEIRLERAHEHIDSLKHESRMFMMELPPAFGYELAKKLANGEYPVKARIYRPPPVRLGVLAGDAAHNLRSALDMIAWELAVKGPKPPAEDDRQTAFPICRNLKAWESNGTKRMVERLPPDAIPVIKSFQPFEQDDWLRFGMIQAIDNWAKHKAIPNLLSFQVSKWQLMSRFEFVSQTDVAFEDGDEIGRVKRVEPIVDPEEHFRAGMMCHVCFSKNGPGQGWPIDFLENTYERIRDKVVPAFQVFFSD